MRRLKSEPASSWTRLPTVDMRRRPPSLLQITTGRRRRGERGAGMVAALTAHSLPKRRYVRPTAASMLGRLGM